MDTKIMPNNLVYVNQGDRQLCLLAPHPLHHSDEKGQRDCQLQVRACSVVLISIFSFEPSFRKKVNNVTELGLVYHLYFILSLEAHSVRSWLLHPGPV